MWEKCLITFICNVVGVYVVKFVEEKTTRDRLWKVELTVRTSKTEILARQLEELNIPFNYITGINKNRWTIFNIYCATQKESGFVKELALKHNAKFFASESKPL
jgi:general stress protein 26